MEHICTIYTHIIYIYSFTTYLCISQKLHLISSPRFWRDGLWQFAPLLLGHLLVDLQLAPLVLLADSGHGKVRLTQVSMPPRCLASQEMRVSFFLFQHTADWFNLRIILCFYPTWEVNWLDWPLFFDLAWLGF